MPTRDPEDTALVMGDLNRAGSHEQRLMPKIVQRGLNQKVSTFPGSFPAHCTGPSGAIREERAEARRERVNMAAISPAFPTKPFKHQKG
jgi:hypothetical protein